MLGAIVGDIVGSRFEFNNWQGGKGFKLFNDHYSSITDDTICTVAIADAILSRTSYKESLLKWCRKYPQPMGGYGMSFAAWLRAEDPQPYYSFGNGAAMRVSPVAWAFADRNEVLREAERTASVSHDHPEGIKGAQAVDVAAMEGGSSTVATSISESIRPATIIFATLPILVVYPFVQRYFVAGVPIGAVKG